MLRRDLQKLYVERLNNILNNNTNRFWIALDFKAFFTPMIDYTDERAVITTHTKKLLSMINKAIPNYKEGIPKII